MYQLTNTDVVIRTADGAHIPADPENADYQTFLEWVAAGNSPDPAPVTPPIKVTVVTMAQARKQLIIEGVMPSEIDALLSQMPHPQGDLAKVDWEFQPNVHRDNALVAYVAQQKGWDSAHVDALFAAAAALT